MVSERMMFATGFGNIRQPIGINAQNQFTRARCEFQAHHWRYLRWVLLRSLFNIAKNPATYRRKWIPMFVATCPDFALSPSNTWIPARARWCTLNQHRKLCWLEASSIFCFAIQWWRVQRIKMVNTRLPVSFSISVSASTSRGSTPTVSRKWHARAGATQTGYCESVQISRASRCLTQSTPWFVCTSLSRMSVEAFLNSVRNPEPGKYE